MSVDSRWRNPKRLTSRQYPVVGVLSVHTPADAIFNLKDFAPDSVISKLGVRVFGTLVKAGAGVGTATGRENPEAIVRTIRLQTTPDLKAVVKNALTARGIISQGIFDQGFAIRETDVTDAAASVAVDFTLPLLFKMPGSANPIEWALPMKRFSQAQLIVNCGGREQLFSGGTNTWDLTGLSMEIQADLDEEVDPAQVYHLTEQFERVIPVTQTTRDLSIELDSGWLYTHLLFIAERDDVVDDTIINNIEIEGGGRQWLPPGEDNDAVIRRFNRALITNPSEVLTGLYYVNALRDGMVSRAIDASDSKVVVRLDVTLGAGTTRRVTLHGRRIVPSALKVAA